MVFFQGRALVEPENQAEGGFRGPLIPLQRGRAGGDGIREDDPAVVHALDGGDDDGLHPVADQVGDAGEGDAGDGEGVGQLLQLPGPPGPRQGLQAEGRFRAGALDAAGGFQQLHGLRRGVQQGDGARLPGSEIGGRGGRTAEREDLGELLTELPELREEAGEPLLQLLRELVRQGLELRDIPAPAVPDFTEEMAQLPGVEGAVEIAVEGVGQEEAGVLPGHSGLQEVPVGGKEPVHTAAVQGQVLPLQLRGNVVTQAAEIHVAPGLDGKRGQAALDEKLLHKDGHVPQGDGEHGVLDQGLVAGGQNLADEGPVFGVSPGAFKNFVGVPGGGRDTGGAGADFFAVGIAADDFGVGLPFHGDTSFCGLLMTDYNIKPAENPDASHTLPEDRGTL